MQEGICNICGGHHAPGSCSQESKEQAHIMESRLGDEMDIMESYLEGIREKMAQARELGINLKQIDDLFIRGFENPRQFEELARNLAVNEQMSHVTGEERTISDKIEALFIPIKAGLKEVLVNLEQQIIDASQSSKN